MRILVTWGSKLGGTEGIGRMVGHALESRGFEVVTVPADEVTALGSFDAVIIGGALYGNRWPRSVRRFVSRHVEQLRRVPVWLFSSGPLDDSADRIEIPPPNGVAVLAERIGAQGHVTFGGRLEPDAKGFIARSMAKTTSGDWRNPDRIRAWAASLAAELPVAKPRRPVEHPARSIPRLVLHGIFGWALSAAIMGILLRAASPTVAMVVHAIAAPLIFLLIAMHYFRGRGARDPLPAAFVWTALFALLHLILFAPGATWLSFALIFLVTWTTGAAFSTLPWRGPEKHAPPALQEQ